MTLLSIILLSIALGIDAFVVAVSTGLTLDNVTGRHLFRLSFHFGLFQALMPLLGWFIGTGVQGYIAEWDHWVAFALLAVVGSKMIHEAFQPEGESKTNDPTRGFSLIALSIATSIDAFAVGLSLAVINQSIWYPALIIGVVCSIMTFSGMLLGKRCPKSTNRKVEVFGGLLLIGLGCKIVIDHTM